MRSKLLIAVLAYGDDWRPLYDISQFNERNGNA